MTTTMRSRVRARGPPLAVVRRKMPEQADTGLETGLYVYGIVPSAGPALPEGPRGMDGAALELVTHDELAAVVTSIALPRPPGRRRDLLSHSDVLNAIVAEVDVVPLRFGTVLRDADDVVEELLDARWESLTKLLDRVADAVQLTLRASYVEERVLA